MKFLATAIDIAHRLVNDAVWYDGRCTWMGDDAALIEGEWKVVYQTVDPYLYSGNAGIARFLMLCWKETQDDIFKKTALGAINHSLYVVENTSNDMLPLGLYDGICGIALIATEIDWLLKQSMFSERVECLISEMALRITSKKEDISDMLSGDAGILMGLIQLSKMIKNINFKKECDVLAEKLLSQSYHTPYGWYWDKLDALQIEGGLCGMAHGASGVSLALLEYYQLSANKNYLEAMNQGVIYERGWFNRDFSNWADIRNLNNQEENHDSQKLTYPVFWCHGAGGIGLARLRAYVLTGDKNILAEVNAALQAATIHARKILKKSKKEVSPEINLSVCHGLGSIIDLFLYAYDVLKDETFLKRARHIGNFSIDISLVDEKEEYWQCGIQGGGETPGLMLGLAGIGYNFLKLHNPLEYPSPIGLEI